MNTARRPSAVIVGAGIGGLCAALALRGIGWDAPVLERRDRTADGGSGISLWPNAMRVLERLGVADQLADLAAPLSADGGLRTPSGRWLTRARPGDAPLIEVVLLHRADLHSVLRAALPEGCVRAGVAVDGLTGFAAGQGQSEAQAQPEALAQSGAPAEPEGKASAPVKEPLRVLASGAAGRFELAADLVIAADGVHSTLRSLIFPSSAPPMYSGHTTWRGITPAGAVDVAGGGETWGSGVKFGHLPLRDQQVYWFAERNAPRGGRNEDERAALLDTFAGWHAPNGELIRATPPQRILRLDVEYLPDLPSYVRGAAALLGDAAHAMTPDLGQGGCQAIEDAAVLAAHLAGAADVPAALLRYDQDRRARTQAIARSARRMGKFSQLSNPAAVALRNTAIRLTPARAALRPLQRISNWTPP
jgi:2-polyprenyl-6-methoxyphenol hydroxylase-like FAD-dependent oxidoreductase